MTVPPALAGHPEVVNVGAQAGVCGRLCFLRAGLALGFRSSLRGRHGVDSLLPGFDRVGYRFLLLRAVGNVDCLLVRRFRWRAFGLES